MIKINLSTFSFLAAASDLTWAGVFLVLAFSATEEVFELQLIPSSSSFTPRFFRTSGVKTEKKETIRGFSRPTDPRKIGKISAKYHH